MATSYNDPDRTWFTMNCRLRPAPSQDVLIKNWFLSIQIIMGHLRESDRPPRAHLRCRRSACLVFACRLLPSILTGCISRHSDTGLSKGDVIATRLLSSQPFSRSGSRTVVSLFKHNYGHSRWTRIHWLLSANWVFPRTEGRGNYILISIRCLG